MGAKNVDKHLSYLREAAPDTWTENRVNKLRNLIKEYFDENEVRERRLIDDKVLDRLRTKALNGSKSENENPTK